MHWLLLLICLVLVLSTVIQCRHLSVDERQQQQSKRLGRQHSERRRHTDNVMAVDGQWSADQQEYQPVVLKLEVHFAATAKKNQKKLKKNRMWMNNQSSDSSTAAGFIHLFLPLSVLPTPAVTSAPETLTTQRPTSKRVNTNKKKKKRKKKKKKQQQKLQIDNDESNTMTEYKAQASSSNRLMPALLLHDDGIPPMLNSLSSDETQQWARWLRCTLCLKDEKKQSDEESALCQLQNVECRLNVTAENELTTSGCQETDTCSQWQRCENGHEIPSLFAALPPCPCTYPTGLVYNDRVWDPLNRHHYRWREISLQSERVDIYRPGAAYCIRSLSVVQKMTLSSQQCCYDDRRRLLTRGWAAGTPALVSPEASVHLSRVTERLPWLACKGDFSRYHLQRPPDNRLNCSINPSDEEYQRQVLLATNY